MCKINSMYVFYMSPALDPAPVGSNGTPSENGETQQQSAGMVYGDTPQDNAHGQQVANNENQNNMNTATGGGRRTRRRRMVKKKKSKKSKKSKRRGHKSIRRKSTRRRSRRVRGRKGMKSKKRMRGGAPCGAGFVLADVSTPIYPDRGGGDQTVVAQTALAQTNGMNMDAQSKLDSHVPEPQS